MNAGTTEIRDFVTTQHRPRNEVAEMALGKMHNFSEHSVGLQRLFGAEVPLDVLPQFLIRVAEAAEQTRTRRTIRGIDNYSKITFCQGGLGRRRNGRHHRKGIR